MFSLTFFKDIAHNPIGIQKNARFQFEVFEKKWKVMEEMCL